MTSDVQPGMPESFLSYARWRHAKASAALLAAAVAAFWLYDPVGPRSGGTWVGYGLGAAAAGLMVWLTWFGVRKRSYASSQPSLRGWLSAHVYLGAALLLLVPLHSAFQFGWNVHTLAYALICAVAVSGGIGTAMYVRLPGAMTANRGGEPIESLYGKIAEADREIAELAGGLPDAYAAAARTSLEETRIGGGLWLQLSGDDPSCGTRRAAEALDRLQSEGIDAGLVDAAARLSRLLAHKASLLRRARLDARHQVLMGAWLLVHVPLSIGALAAVAAHVFSVFYYW